MAKPHLNTFIVSNAIYSHINAYYSLMVGKEHILSCPKLKIAEFLFKIVNRSTDKKSNSKLL